MSNVVKFHFLKPGLQTTIQDMGRPGFQEFGVPIGGAMDKQSMKTANRLVGNPPDTPVLEITLLGPKIEIEGNCQVALAGADLSPQVNGFSIPQYETLELNHQDILTFGKINSGCRAYLAIRGRWKVRSWLNSQSAAAYTGLISESQISKGSIIEVETFSGIPKKTLPEPLRPEFTKNLVIRVLPGPEFENFPRQTIAHFFGTTYQLSSDSNRMGYRLEPSVSEFKPLLTIISSGIVPGTIQLPPSGHPIVLMMDAQTTGGYPRLANVISADLDLLAQLKPGDKLRFQLIDLNGAQEVKDIHSVT